MSGGTFDYWQNHIEYIIEKIESLIQKSGKAIPERLWDYFLRKYPEDRVNPTYKDETLRRYEEAIYALKKAYIYAQRIDWLVAGDDGEEEFEKRLTEELAQLDKESRIGDNGERYVPVDRDVDPYQDVE